jgi:hypothetical protein
VNFTLTKCSQNLQKPTVGANKTIRQNSPKNPGLLGELAPFQHRNSPPLSAVYVYIFVMGTIWGLYRGRMVQD